MIFYSRSKNQTNIGTKQAKVDKELNRQLNRELNRELNKGQNKGQNEGPDKEHTNDQSRRQIK
jgi:hypothetical protein